MATERSEIQKALNVPEQAPWKLDRFFWECWGPRPCQALLLGVGPKPGSHQSECQLGRVHSARTRPALLGAALMPMPGWFANGTDQLAERVPAAQVFQMTFSSTLLGRTLATCNWTGIARNTSGDSSWCAGSYSWRELAGHKPKDFPSLGSSPNSKFLSLLNLTGCAFCVLGVILASAGRREPEACFQDVGYAAKQRWARLGELPGVALAPVSALRGVPGLARAGLRAEGRISATNEPSCSLRALRRDSSRRLGASVAESSTSSS